MDLRRLKLTDKTQWGRLIGLCFNQSSSDMERLMYWLSCIGPIEAYGLWDNDTLVAQYACLLRTVYVDDKPIYVGMSINMAVNPAYRGQGLIKQVSQPIYDSLQDKNVMFGMGFSNAQGVKVDKHSRGYGYQVVGKMQPLIIMLRSFKRPQLILYDNLPRLQSDISNHQQKAHLHKGLNYIMRRYSHHPFRQYHYGIWQEDTQILGIVVYKKVKLWGVPSVALLDVYSDDITELLMRWSTTLREQNMYLCHTLVSQQSVIKYVLQQHWRILHAPFSRTPYYLTVKPLSNLMKPSLLDFCEWDLIGGDVL
jgi:hypothetical protein